MLILGTVQIMIRSGEDCGQHTSAYDCYTRTIQVDNMLEVYILKANMHPGVR